MPKTCWTVKVFFYIFYIFRELRAHKHTKKSSIIIHENRFSNDDEESLDNCIPCTTAKRNQIALNDTFWHDTNRNIIWWVSMANNERSAREIIAQRELFVYWKITSNYVLRDYWVWSGVETRIGKYVTNKSRLVVESQKEDEDWNLWIKTSQERLSAANYALNWHIEEMKNVSNPAFTMQSMLGVRSFPDAARISNDLLLLKFYHLLGRQFVNGNCFGFVPWDFYKFRQCWFVTPKKYWDRKLFFVTCNYYLFM